MQATVSLPGCPGCGSGEMPACVTLDEEGKVVEAEVLVIHAEDEGGTPCGYQMTVDRGTLQFYLDMQAQTFEEPEKREEEAYLQYPPQPFTMFDKDAPERYQP
jgi:hypothetical protein